MRTLHLLPTSAMKFLRERVDEKPSLTFPTRLTVSRCSNPMNIAVSLSSVSFVIVAEVQPAAEPVEPIAPRTTFRSPVRCFTVASRLALVIGVQLMSSFSSFAPWFFSRTRYLYGFFMRVKETSRDLRPRQRSRNGATDASKSWSWLSLSFLMLGRGTPASAVVSFSKVVSVYGSESIGDNNSRIQQIRTQFFIPATFSVSSLPQFCNTPANDTGVTEV